MPDLQYPTPPPTWLSWFASSPARWPELRRAEHADGCPAGAAWPHLLWLCECGATSAEDAEKRNG